MKSTWSPPISKKPQEDEIVIHECLDTDYYDGNKLSTRLNQELISILDVTNADYIQVAFITDEGIDIKFIPRITFYAAFDWNGSRWLNRNPDEKSKILAWIATEVIGKKKAIESLVGVIYGQTSDNKTKNKRENKRSNSKKENAGSD